tara:strand:- start:2431 stop:2553 length:123 start_codon:yes stop_codon:yes gene_type:complete
MTPLKDQYFQARIIFLANEVGKFARAFDIQGFVNDIQQFS